jgi:hypothetical protein
MPEARRFASGRGDRDFGDAQYELAQNIIDAAHASVWLAGHGND